MFLECPNCRRKIEKEWDYCPSCGRELDVETREYTGGLHLATVLNIRPIYCPNCGIGIHWILDTKVVQDRWGAKSWKHALTSNVTQKMNPGDKARICGPAPLWDHLVYRWEDGKWVLFSHEDHIITEAGKKSFGWKEPSGLKEPWKQQEPEEAGTDGR